MTLAEDVASSVDMIDSTSSNHRYILGRSWVSDLIGLFTSAGYL